MFRVALFSIVLFIYLFIIFFFRKPERVNKNKNIIVSPCDGTVTYVTNNKMSVFLSVFDVHWQYIPIDSYVKNIEIIKGTFNLAFGPESGHNAGIKVTFSSKLGDIQVTQRVGFFVRRIDNDIQIKDVVKQSDPYGIIRFGSRVDILLPDTYKCIVNKGDKVIGGITPLI